MINRSQEYNDKLCANSDLVELFRIRKFVNEKAELFGFSDQDASQIGLAVDEACTNIIKHSFNFDKNKNLFVKIEPNRDFFIINISDDGKPFNPLSIPDVDMKEYIKQFKRGGLGIHIIRKVMDEIEYFPSKGNNTMNILKLKKSL